MKLPIDGEPGRSKRPGGVTGSEERVEASIGKGARDLAGRLRYQADGELLPSATIELEANMGPNTSLLGPDATYFRLQPALVAGLLPRADTELFAGAGVGPALVVDGMCTKFSSDRCMVLPREESVSPALRVKIGTRMEWAGPPIVVQSRLSALGGHGWTGTFNFALEVGE